MKKGLAFILAVILVASLCSCTSSGNSAEQKPEVKTAEKTSMPTDGTVIPYYAHSEKNDKIVTVHYEGLDMEGLESANQHYGSENFGDALVYGGCSITFADYIDGTTGSVRNMDLQRSNYCSYQLMIEPGDNVNHPVWALSYTGVDDKTYGQLLESGMNPEHYKMLPFQTTDAMSFGLDNNGEEGSLYCALLMRGEQQDEEGNYIWTCNGTYPGAKYRCATHSLPIMFTSQYVTVEDALKAVGAVDEEYKRIYPDEDPTIDVFTFNIEKGDYSNHWFEAVAMEDSTGHHGVLEFVDDHAIWHDNIDYSFNFFLQKEYLQDENGKYIEDHGVGLGRYEATVPYLDNVHTISDHLSLMDGIRYSFLTYYDIENKYIGYDYQGNPVDWRSEVTGTDVFATYEKMHDILKLNTKEADEKYPLWAQYKNTETGKIEKIGSYDYWKENKDHLEYLWTLDYVMQENNRSEVENFIGWNGQFYNHLTQEEVVKTGAGWETYFKVIANPMKHEVTRWFNEDVSTTDTITEYDFIFETP